MSYLIALIFGLSIIAGPASLPTYLTEVGTIEAPVTAPLAPEVVAPEVEVAPILPTPEVAPEVRCEEDMECWDPETMGNGISGKVWETDAYLSYDALGVAPVESPEEMILSYVGTHEVELTNLGPNQFTVTSIQYPNTYHVLQWDTLKHA